MNITLRGMTWNHSRGFTPVVATAQRFGERNPDIQITWEKRSLQEFADKPIDGLAKSYDLLVIDHPWAGFAAAHKILQPLEQWLPATFLEEQAANSVGKSHESYRFDGSQWALAIDAACPVSAFRKDLLDRHNEAVPESFDELIALAEKGLVCCPSIPLDVYGNFLNLLRAAGEEIFPNDEEVAHESAGLQALERLKQLSDRIPSEFLAKNPILTLEHMSTTDDFAYCPYTYGYVNYSRPGFAERQLQFGDVIGMEKGRPGATMLGGTGLAISAHSPHPEAAAAYVMYAASPQTQKCLAYPAGAQPGHRSIWLDEEINATCQNFFQVTLPTLDRAFVRPRYKRYLEFQDTAGEPIHKFLSEGGEAKTVLAELNKLYRSSVEASS